MRKNIFIVTATLLVCLLFNSCYNTVYEGAVIKKHDENVVTLPEGEKLHNVAYSRSDIHIITKKVDEPDTYLVYDVVYNSPYSGNLALDFIIKEQ